MLLTAEVADVDIQAIIAGAGSGIVGADAPIEVPFAAVPLPPVAVSGEELLTLHEEFRWADSKLMQASERLAEAQEARRKDLVALAIMRRELRASFSTERSWVRASMSYFGDVLPALSTRELELADLVDAGVRTEAVIHELAAVRAERKIFDIAIVQSQTQLARIDDNELTMEYQVASESYDREPDGNSMRELARLRASSTAARRAATRARTAGTTAIEELGLVTTFGEITAAGAFLAAEHEGDERARERMDRIRAAQSERELSYLPEVEAAWKSGLKHPVHFMRARKGAK
jgi:hypothetical protein